MSYAKSIDFLFNQMRNAATGSLASCWVQFYAAGNTTTPKAVYLDRAMTTPAANPYQLSADGTAELYGSGIYRIVVKANTNSAPGATIYDYDYVAFQAPEQTPLVSDYPSLTAAVTAIGATETTLVIDADTTLTANTAIPATLAVEVRNGAVITCGAYTLTGLKEARPEWFGTGLTALQLAAIASTNIIVDTNITASTATLQDGSTLTGTGVITQHSGSGDAHFIIVGSNCRINGVTIVGYTTTVKSNYGALYFAGESNIVIENCKISGKQVGIQFGTPLTTDTCSNIIIRDNQISSKNIGIYSVGYFQSYVAAAYVTDLQILNNVVKLGAGFDATSTENRGIKLYNTANALIDGNNVTGYSLSIETFIASEAFARQTGIKIINNAVDIWISATGTTGAIIANNTVDYFNRPTIHHDHPDYPQAIMIEILAADTLICANNMLRGGPSTGIQAGNHSQSTGDLNLRSWDLLITGNIIDQCCSDATTEAPGAIQVGSAYNIDIVNNRIVDCGTVSKTSYGIAAAGNFASGKFGQLRSLRIIDNHISGHITGSGNHGTLFVYYCRDVVISGNVIEDNLGSGLSLTGTPVNVHVDNNTFSNNSGYGINGSGWGDFREVKVENNTLTGNNLGAIDTVYPDVYADFTNNVGMITGIADNTRNTFLKGYIFPVAHNTTIWRRCTVSGTFIPTAVYNSVTATATTESGSATITVNKAGAAGLVPGQYITIVGVTGTKIVKKITFAPYEAVTGDIPSAVITLDSNCDATVTDANIGYNSGTFVSI